MPATAPAFRPPPILDIEASGFGPSSYPIEVGLILPDGCTYCSLIRPLDAWTHWDASAEAIHRVARSTLVAHGRSPADVAHALNLRLHGQTIYCDAWYHDFTWLGRLFDAADLPQLFRLEDIRSLLGETDMEVWHATKTDILAELGLQRHRASNDARVLQQTLLRVKGWTAPIPAEAQPCDRPV
ncbi:MAG TPA: hypothetical protein PKX01_03830 [Rhodocyclaceae bacterium]|nr:hypothetical protein [Rhodocyclaceae bacterium]HMZ75283.1 hypothetical protein [Rhodocyclaceae bacterium]